MENSKALMMHGCGSFFPRSDQASWARYSTSKDTPFDPWSLDGDEAAAKLRLEPVATDEAYGICSSL